MKTNGTTIVLLIAVAVCGFCFSLGERRAMALVNCAASPCEDTYSWWGGNNANGQTFSAQVPNATFPFMAGDNTTYSVINIFVPAPTGAKLPLVVNGNFDSWLWPNSQGNCSLVNGQILSPQQVFPGGVPNLPQNGVGLVRKTCSH